MLSRHAELRGSILELRHKSLHARHDTIERALDLQSKLTGWGNQVHDIAMTDQSDEGDYISDRSTSHGHGPVSHLHRTLLVVLQHESTIALNRPLLAKKPATSASQAALQACIHASRAIIEAVDARQLLNMDGGLNETAPMQALMTWPLMTWSVWMSCFILTFAALEGFGTESAQR